MLLFKVAYKLEEFKTSNLQELIILAEPQYKVSKKRVDHKEADRKEVLKKV